MSHHTPAANLLKTVQSFPDTFPELSLETPLRLSLLFNSIVQHFGQLVYNKKPHLSTGLILYTSGERWKMVVHLSGEDVTILEFTCDVVVTNEPSKILLMNTIGHAITEAIDERIQTRFGGVGLPSTVKDLEKLITDSSNVVAVKVNLRLTTFLTECNTCVGILPINVVMNSVAHLLFDLTHVWCRLVDFYTIQEMGGNTTPLVPLVQLVVDRHDFFIRIKCNLTRHLDINLEIFDVENLTRHVHDFIPHSEAIPDDSYTLHDFGRCAHLL
jgi:hypothetical protein